jgi:hypothetical protein
MIGVITSVQTGLISQLRQVKARKEKKYGKEKGNCDY